MSLYFCCPTCHLVLDSAEVLEAAEMPAQFRTIDESGDYFEPDDYGND